MIELPRFSSYSKNLWDYLADMPYMPTAADREQLKKTAADRSQAYRVQIWDYFFQPRPEDVGKALRDELSELRMQAAGTETGNQQRLAQSHNALTQLEQTWQNEFAATQAQLLAIQNETAGRERAGASKTIRTGMALAGGSFLSGLVIYMFGLGASSQNSTEGCLAQLGAGCLGGLWFLVGIPLIIIGIAIAIGGSRRQAPERIRALVGAQQQRVRDLWAERDLALKRNMDAERAQIASAQEILQRLVPHLQSRIAFLERGIEELILQLPPVPTEDQVEEWLSSDLDELLERGKEQLGIEGEIIQLRGAKDHFVLRGPAEIQRSDSIPPTYRENPNRRKYLHARQFGRTTNGRVVRHYGVFYLEILFITGAVLARYSVFFDFIRGELIGERAPQQHFADIVLLEMRREYRKITINGRPDPVILEKAPSMFLSLNSGDQVSITLPNAEYFDAFGAPPAAEGDYDANQAADSALRAITLRVKEAKKNLEVGQLARMKEAERED